MTNGRLVGRHLSGGVQPSLNSLNQLFNSSLAQQMRGTAMLRSVRVLTHSIAAIAAVIFTFATPAVAEKRIALVIGNSNYAHAGVLANPANDANDMADALRGLGFEVILGLDLDKAAFDTRVRAFSNALVQADAGLLFYAGHGMQVAGRNYLIPIDAKLGLERDLDFEAVSLDFILKQMELEREGKTNIVFLDACRDNPLARNLARSMGTRSAAIGRGLAQIQTGVGSFISYSTQPGNVALDGTGRNSPFTTALVRSVTEPGRNLTATMIDVRKQVLSATGGKQVPWDHSALTGDFYFHLASAPGLLAKPVPGGTGPDSDAMQRRLKELEEEVRRKADPQQTVRLVELTNLKERVRQIEVANRADQQRIFDTNRKYGTSNDAAARMSHNREIGDLQMQMVRRSQEQKTLKEQMAKLEADLGLPTAASTPK
jgi:Caspase domain